MELQLVSSAKPEEITEKPSVSLQESVEYLRNHPDSELAVEIIESWLLSENNEYRSLDLESALRGISSSDLVRKMAIERLIDGFARNNGKVLADINETNRAYRKRLDEIERIRKAKPLGKIFRRVLLALKDAFHALTDNVADISQRIDSVSAQIAVLEAELRSGEIKKLQTNKDANDIMIQVSAERRRILESAHQQATEITTEALAKAQRIIAEEREKNEALVLSRRRELYDAYQKIAILENRQFELLQKTPELANQANLNQYKEEIALVSDLWRHRGRRPNQSLSGIQKGVIEILHVLTNLSHIEKLEGPLQARMVALKLAGLLHAPYWDILSSIDSKIFLLLAEGELTYESAIATYGKIWGLDHRTSIDPLYISKITMMEFLDNKDLHSQIDKLVDNLSDEEKQIDQEIPSITISMFLD